jgi:DNA-binding transcriptional ArsR family regulator
MDAELMELAESQAALCSIFANPKRVLILWSVAQEEKTVTAIAQSIDASLQCTSQHLSVMKAAGILESRRDGQSIFYQIADDCPHDHCLLLLQARENTGQSTEGAISPEAYGVSNHI